VGDGTKALRCCHKLKRFPLVPKKEKVTRNANLHTQQPLSTAPKATQQINLALPHLKNEVS
jgi:hypothetical protein